MSDVALQKIFPMRDASIQIRKLIHFASGIGKGCAEVAGSVSGNSIPP
jgi:hypothetical protein